MQNEFKALLKKDIYAILDGDTLLKAKDEDEEYETIMPYLTGQQLVDLCKTFGLYQQYGASRWTYVEELLKYGIQNDRCDEILAYIFDKERFTSLTRLSSPEEVNEAYKTIVNAAIDRINSILYLGRTELQCVNGNFYVTEIGKTVSVSSTNIKLINVPYVRSLRERCEEDFLASNYDSVITKSRTLMEEVLIYVLEENKVVPSDKGDLNVLYNQVKTLFGMQQSPKYDKRINSMLGGLEKIVSAVCEMRNNDSDAHGAGSKRINIRDYEARLTMNSAITFCEYYLDIDKHHRGSRV